MNNIVKRLSSLRIIPVVIMEKEDAAESLAQALIAGGLPCVEVTFRTCAARGVLVRIKKAFPSMLVGAGTVVSSEQVDMAIDAGAEFIVSPGMNPKIVEYCHAHNITITPGIATPTEIEMAMDRGLNVVKFFPAEACGGVKYLKAISAPYNNIKFIPTGGISESNLLTYLDLPGVLACGGSWMVSPELINSGAFDEIERRTRSAVSMLHSHQ